MAPVTIDGQSFAEPDWPGSPDLPRLLARLLATMRPLFGAAACSVALASDESSLTFVAASGEGAADVVGQNLPTDRGVAGWAATSGQTISVADVQADARFAHDVAQATGYLPQRITAVPVTRADTTIGVVEVLDGDSAVLNSAAGSSALFSLAAAVADLVTTLAGRAGESPARLRLLEALDRIEDDPDLVDHVTAVVTALGGGPGRRR